MIDNKRVNGIYFFKEDDLGKRGKKMGRFVIVAYKPKPGKEQRLVKIVKKHIAILRVEKLVTSNSAYIMKAADGTIVEVFEWLSAKAIERAHENPSVKALWEEFNDVCEYLPLTKVPETHQMFAEFEAI